jgi:metal-sulfur cluster biosynthetic enzyme
LIQEEGIMDEFEKEQRLREVIDMKIERVVMNLGITRSSVHFIENYKTE